MRRVLPDTNFYGLLGKDTERIKLVGNVKSNKALVLYGFKVIRNELRDVPKKIRLEGKNLRIDLLNLYDEITNERNFELTENMEKIADDYYKRNKSPKFFNYEMFKRTLRGESYEFI